MQQWQNVYWFKGEIYMKTLKDISIGDACKVVKLHGKGATLGDPIQLNVRGYELSIRKSEAELIEVA